ncbi:MAG: hypothetical protein HYX92_02075 [Chloroflexi bacterium]|nr:hypothetical protein [Chloroflexota bacterium]
MASLRLTSTRMELEGSLEAINREFHRRGWTDGHPIFPPTQERMERFLQAVGQDPAKVVAILEASKGEATIEKIAINAVMAGCEPEYMPIITAAVECIAEKPDLLYSWLTTSHSTSPLLIVNGPIRSVLDISSGRGGTTVSWQANAAIGRAIRLILLNVAGVAGATDMHAHGWLVKYSYCMGENEEESPWEPYHVEQGLSTNESAVTVFVVEPPHHVEPLSSGSAQGLMGAIADSMATAACRNTMGDAFPLLVLCPHHAKAIASGGFSKADVKRFFYEHARIPLYRFDPGQIDFFYDNWRKFYSWGPHAMVPMVEKASDLHVIVFGGPGPNSLFIPGFARMRPVTRKVEIQ